MTDKKWKFLYLFIYLYIWLIKTYVQQYTTLSKFTIVKWKDNYEYK